MAKEADILDSVHGTRERVNAKNMTENDRGKPYVCCGYSYPYKERKCPARLTLCIANFGNYFRSDNLQDHIHNCTAAQKEVIDAMDPTGQNFDEEQFLARLLKVDPEREPRDATEKDESDEEDEEYTKPKLLEVRIKDPQSVKDLFLMMCDKEPMDTYAGKPVWALFLDSKTLPHLMAERPAKGKLQGQHLVVASKKNMRFFNDDNRIFLHIPSSHKLRVCLQFSSIDHYTEIKCRLQESSDDQLIAIYGQWAHMSEDTTNPNSFAHVHRGTYGVAIISPKQLWLIRN